jgi:molybdopterin converting factor small subunit
MTMILAEEIDTYNMTYDVDNELNLKDLNNKLFCTFTNLEQMDALISELKAQYSIIYNKMFVLEIVGKNEYVITYNVEQGNVSDIPANTILVHRKKDSNTLYTINALNELIKKLNGGVVDTKFPIEWQHYRNCILLTNNNELNQLNTKIHKIVEV